MAWENCQGIFEGYELLQLTASGLAKIGDPNAAFYDNDFDSTTGDSIIAYKYPTEGWRVIIDDGTIGWMVDHSGSYEYYNNVLYPAPTVYDWVRRGKANSDSFTFKLVLCVDSDNQVAMLGTRTDFGDFSYFTNSVFYDDAINYLNPIVQNGGGAGSGYIGNSLVSNKKMVGYNVPISSAESTKTESVNDVSASAVSGKPKSGNGFARIKLIAEPMPTQNLEYFRKNAGRFDNYVSFNMQDVIKSNDAKPYLLGDKDIVGYPGGGSWSYSYDSTSDTYTISTGSQVDYNFAVNRIQNPYRVIIECDVEPSSGRQAWISLVATYVNNDGNAVEVASSEGDNFLWISESIHMRLVFYNDVLPYIDYIRTATGNGPWSNFRISNFKITLFQ